MKDVVFSLFVIMSHIMMAILTLKLSCPYISGPKHVYNSCYVKSKPKHLLVRLFFNTMLLLAKPI